MAVNFEDIQTIAPDYVALILRDFETDTIEYEAFMIDLMDFIAASPSGDISEYIRMNAPLIMPEVERNIAQVYKETGEAVTQEGDNRALAAGLVFGALWANMGARRTHEYFTTAAQTRVRNILLTSAPATERVFHDTIGEAFRKVQAGMGIEKAKVWAANECARRGVVYVDYTSGRRDHIDVAARRSLLGGLNQYYTQITQERYTELGAVVVETSAHNGARPEHADWQGLRFGYHGEVTIQGVRYPDFVTATDIGSITGLLGINCRHSYYPVFDLESDPSYSGAELDAIMNRTVNYEGEDIPQYEAEQYQRGLERKIRETKRRVAAVDALSGADAASEATKLKGRLREQVAGYRDFTNQTGLNYYRYRLMIERGGQGRIAV